eukprot:SAG31_NODE_35182_length_325_cov_1.123894_1_plen_20_part_10
MRIAATAPTDAFLPTKIHRV